jgi:tetrapyrrole methylase family protein/MazG family protein
MKSDRGERFEKLCQVMERLRGPDGCVWDRQQDNHSVKTYVLEEAYEVAEAVEKVNPSALREELGDLLFLIIFMAQIAAEEEKFNISEVMAAIEEKMIRRHPHVFGDSTVRDAEDVRDRWIELKSEEKRDERSSILDGVPVSLPSLLRAHRLTERAATVGFDWAKPGDVMEKVEEELKEFRSAVTEGNREKIEEELGDLLFVLVNCARSFRVNSEEALRASIEKFIRRFHHIEERMQAQGRSIQRATLQEMDKFWDEAKRMETKG